MHASHISLRMIEHAKKISQFLVIYYPIPNWKKFSRRLYKLYYITIILPLSKFHFLQTISPLSSSNPTESSQGSSPLPSKRRKRPHSENHRLIMTNRAHVDVTERKKMSDPWEKKKKRKIKSVGSGSSTWESRDAWCRASSRRFQSKSYSSKINSLVPPSTKARIAATCSRPWGRRVTLKGKKTWKMKKKGGRRRWRRRRKEKNGERRDRRDCLLLILVHSPLPPRWLIRRGSSTELNHRSSPAYGMLQ